MSKTKTHEEFVKEVYDLVGDEYIILEKYTNTNTKILMQHNCTLCNNHQYYVRPTNFISTNARCPKCNLLTRKRKRRSHEEFCAKVYEQVEDNYTVVGEYVKSDEKILMKHNCLLCDNHEYYVTPKNFLNNNQARCPKCFKIRKEKYYVSQWEE